MYAADMTFNADLLLQAVLLAGLGVLEADITTSSVTQIHMSIQLIGPVTPQRSQCLLSGQPGVLPGFSLN